MDTSLEIMTTTKQLLATIVISLGLLGGVVSNCGQALDHIYVGSMVYNTFHGQIPFEDITMPLALMGSHVACDYVFSEGSLGPTMHDQVLVNGLFAWVGFEMMADTQAKRDYAYVLFWSMLPDLIDKSCGTQIFHNYSQQPVINLDSQQELELMGLELISFKYLF